MLYVISCMILTLSYRFCHSDFVILSVIYYIVHDTELCYIFCQNNFVCLSVICYIVHDADIVL